MNGFIKKSVGTLTLGEKLQKLRSERRASLNEVSKYTRIQIKYLEYLEEGAYAKMPADVYVRGFLRSYAEFLGVEERNLIRLYDKESEIKKNLEKSKLPKIGWQGEKKKAIDVSSFVFTPRILAVALVALAAIGGFFYLYKEIGAFASTPRLVVLSPENNYSTDGNSITVEGVTDRDARIFLNGAPILVSDDGKFRESVTVQPGANTINIKASNKFDKAIETTLTVQSTVKAAPANPTEQADGADLPAQGQKSLDMEVRVDPGPVWVSVEADDNLVFSGTVLTGATQAFQAEKKIVVSSGKGNATFIKFNGKDVGALSENASAVKNATFTADTKY